MKIELKAIKHYPSMSEETESFQGKLYINGKYCADVKNDGRGGCTDIRGVDKESNQVLAETEQYLAEQPKKKIEVINLEYVRTVESEVDDLFEAWLKGKADKKFAKEMDKGILYGTKHSYQMIYWPSATLTAMLKNPVGQARVKKILAELTEKGETIMNTNIPQELYPKFKIGDSVEVPEPNDTDIHNHSFVGTITKFRNGNAIVQDGEGDGFEIEVERLTLAE
jgi:hypothetical protein